jgi:DNA repair exonuclease SbcCD nuclease subunit
MKILCLGDLHIRLNSIKEVDIYFKELYTWLENNPVDIIVNHGDTLDTHARLHSLCLNKALEYANLLTKFALVYWIIGNHDMVDESKGINSLHWANCLKSLPKLIIVDQPIYDKEFVFCPYVPKGTFITTLDKFVPWKNAKIIFSHIDIKGAKMGSITLENADAWLKDYPLLITGHIHQKQKLAENMIYIGSIMQVASDEPPDKSILFIDDKQIKEIVLNLPRKQIVHYSISEINNFTPLKDPFLTNIVYLSGTPEEIRTFRKTTDYTKLLQKVGSKNIRFRTTNETKKVISAKFKGFKELLRESIKEEDELSELFEELLTEN